VLNLALLNQFLDCSGHVFDGHVRVNPVLIKQIEGLNLESLERSLGDLLDVLWTAIQTCPAGTSIRIGLEPELGGDHHLSAERRKRFTKEFFVGEGTVDFSRIEEGDASVNRRVKKRDHLLLVANRAVAIGHSHTTEPESRNFQVTVSEFTLLHFLNSYLLS